MLNFHELFNPEEIRSSLSSADYVKAAINYVAVGLVLAVLAAVGTILLSFLGGNVVGGIITGVAIVIGYPILTIISALVVNAVFFLPAKIVGGKASFKEQFYGMSMIVTPLLLVVVGLYILLILSVLAMFILVGFLIAPIVYILLIAFMFYMYYAIWTMFKEIHGLSNKNQILAVSGGLLILGIIFGVIVAVLFGAVFLTALSSSMPTAGLFGLM